MIFDFFFTPALAESIPLEVGIGRLGVITGDWPLLNYVAEMYQFVIAGIGILAATMIMLNGLRWVAAAGNPEMITTAKTGITGAVVGLLLALTSFVILNTVNPELTILDPLDMEDIAFRPPVTTSETAIMTGDISQDETLIHYNDELPFELGAVLDDQASEPYITEPTYAALVNALTTLSDPNSEYYGMELVIAGANRSLTRQEIFWACYVEHGTPDTGPCPEGCQNPGGAACNEAARPGSSLHGYGNALDVSWRNTGAGNWVTTTGYASSAWHNSCLVDATPDSSCDPDLIASVEALNEMMRDAGFARLCSEWWHHQVGGSEDSVCQPGVYQ